MMTSVQVVAKFDRELEPNWGLAALVGVGETWLPAMKEMVSPALASLNKWTMTNSCHYIGL
jgi:hypothetical protein